MVADVISNLAQRHDLLDLAQGAREGQARAWIEQHRLVPLLQQIDVTLEDVIREDLADPPDARGDLHCVASVSSL